MSISTIHNVKPFRHADIMITYITHTRHTSSLLALTQFLHTLFIYYWVCTDSSYVCTQICMWTPCIGIRTHLLVCKQCYYRHACYLLSKITSCNHAGGLFQKLWQSRCECNLYYHCCDMYSHLIDNHCLKKIILDARWWWCKQHSLSILNPLHVH